MAPLAGAGPSFRQNRKDRAEGQHLHGKARIVGKQGGQRPQRYSVGSGKNGGNPVHGDESLRTTAQNTRARVVAARPREVHYENRLILHGQPLSPSVFGKNRRAGLRTGYF